MSSINMLTGFFKENMKYEKKIYALFEQHQQNRLTPGCGKDGPYLGQDGSSPFFAPYIFSSHDCRLFCGLQC